MDHGSDISECQDCLCLASRAASRAITAVFDRHLRPHGIRATQFTLLTMLMLRGGTPIGVLAKSLGMDRTTLTRNVALLETKGWVQSRTGGSDARSHIVSVMGSGAKVARSALPAWRAAQNSVAGAIGVTGVTAMHRLARTEVS
jgi:DNA-binding MarR family transcriptional regulator